MKAKGASIAVVSLTVVMSCRALVGYEDTEATPRPGVDGGLDAAAGAAGGGGVGGSAGESGAAGTGGAAGNSGSGGTGGDTGGAAGSDAGDAGGPPLMTCDGVFISPKLGLDLQAETGSMRTIEHLMAPRVAVQNVMLGFASHAPGGSQPLHWIRGDLTDATTGSHVTIDRPLAAGVAGSTRIGLLMAEADADGGPGESLALWRYPLDEPYYVDQAISYPPGVFTPPGTIANAKFVSNASSPYGGVAADVFDGSSRKGYAGVYTSSAPELGVIYQGSERDRLLFARSEQVGKQFVFVRNTATQRFTSYVLAEPSSLLSSTDFGDAELEIMDAEVNGKGVLHLFVWDAQSAAVLLGNLDVGVTNQLTHQDVAPALSQPSTTLPAAVAAMRWSQDDLLGVAPSEDAKGIDAVWYQNGVLRFEGSLISGVTGTITQAVAVVDPDTSTPGVWVMWVQQFNGSPSFFHRVYFQRFLCSETT